MNVSVATVNRSIGLGSKKTGLPFYVWFISRDGEHIEMETSQTSSGENPTVYRIMPVLQRRRGPHIWSNMSMVGEFRRLNLPLITDFWNGKIVEGKDVSDRVVRVAEDFVADALFRETQMQKWYSDQEAIIVVTGKAQREYLPFREPPPDHPD